jgi:hypothetical protein
LGTGMALYAGAGERRVKPFTNLSISTWDAGHDPATSVHGQQYLNPFVAFKVSQAWGRWDTSVTANPIHATYYTANTPGFDGCNARPGTTWCDRPSDTRGYAVASGLIVNTPWIAPGDIFGAFGAYGAGAGAYATGNNLVSPGLYSGGNNIALGAFTDAVYLNGRGFELTTSWTAGAYFTHYWTPQFSTTVFGSQSGVSYNDTIINARWFCGPSAANDFRAATQGVVVPSTSKCDPGFGYGTIGAHADWYPVSGFRLGVEVLYTGIDTAFEGSQVTLSRNGARPAGTYEAKDEGIASVIFRAQRQWPAGGN